MTRIAARPLRTLVLAALGAASGIAVAAEDFRSLSNEELIERRAEVRTMSEDDRIRFREEMQNRARDMTSEERARAGVGEGSDAMGGDRTRERRRIGEDNDRGQGEMSRERRRLGNGGGGYGQGYEARQRGMSPGGSATARGGMGGGRGR